MKLPFRLNGNLFALFLGIYFVFYLASSYLGGVYSYVSRFLSVMLLLDLLHLLWSFKRIRYSQNFSTTHPVKGQDVEYILRIRMESPIPGARLLVTFKGIRQDLRLEFGVKTLDYFPRAGSLEEHRKQIQCPFRGTYTVGLDALEIQDALGLLWVQVPVWFITFYVYPRLIELHSCRLSGEGRHDLPTSLSDGAIVDPTRFRSLHEYRSGESVRYLAWKKFAATGIPYLKDWEHTAFPGITLYLDTLRHGELDYQTLLAEDCALEILLALARWFVLQDVPVYVRLAQDIVRLDGGIDDFPTFMAEMAKLPFLPGRAGVQPSLATDLETDMHNGTLATVAVAGIFRGFDKDVVSFIENRSDDFRQCYAIVLGLALTPEVRAQLISYHKSAPLGHRLILVRDSETIKEDLS